MRIRLTRKIPLKSANVYLRLKQYVHREDIKNFLNGKETGNTRLDNGIRNYLKKIRIFDEQGNLTSEGKEAKDNGRVADFEEGKYRIWYTGNEASLEEPMRNKIYYFFRESPQKESNRITALDLHFDENNKEHLCLPTTPSNPLRYFYVEKPVNGFVGTVNPNVVNINLERNLTESNTEDIYSGNINQSTHILDTSIKINNENLEEWVKKLLPEGDWNETTKRYRISFNVFEEKSEGLETFERNQQIDESTGYTGTIEKLPLEPINLEEAKLWRNCLLDKELTHDYIHPNDFNAKAISINHKEGFTSYHDALDQPKAEEFMSLIKPSKKSETGAAFWHLSAPFDLRPDVPVGVFSSHFELFQGNKTTFDEISAKIKTKEVIKVFYYDQYIINKWQQKAACAFLKSFGCDSNFIITNVSEQRADIIKRDQAITQIDMKTIFNSQKPQHDRYLIFAVHGEIEVWNISDSIDFIRFDNSNITSSTEGTIQQSVTFNKASRKGILHKPLLNFIEQEVKNV